MRSNETLAKHGDWVDEVLAKHPDLGKENVNDILREEIGIVFMKVLEDAGVYKMTDEGLAAFRRFIEKL